MCVHDTVSSCQTYIINLCRVVYQRICGLSKVTSLTLETLNVKFISNYFYGRSRQCSAENHQRDFFASQWYTKVIPKVQYVYCR